MSISYSGYDLGRLLRKRVHGRHGAGTGLLNMDVEFDWHGLQVLGNRIRITHVIGMLKIIAANESFDLGTVSYLNEGSPTRLPALAVEVNLPFCCELFPVHINAIEEVRKGGPVVLELGVRLVLEDYKGNEHRQSTSTQNYEVVRFELEAETWSKLLSGMGYRKELLISVPIETADSHPTWKSASAAFLRAEKSFRNGLARETVSACREVLEVLQERWPRTDELPNPSWNLEKRYCALLAAAKHLTDPAHHSDGRASTSSSPVVYDLDDAKVVIALTATLLAKALHQIINE